MNSSRKTWLLFIAVLAVAAIAFIAVATVYLVSCLVSGGGTTALLWTGIALSAVYFGAGVALFVLWLRGKRL